MLAAVVTKHRVLQGRFSAHAVAFVVPDDGAIHKHARTIGEVSNPIPLEVEYCAALVGNDPLDVTLDKQTMRDAGRQPCAG